MTENAAPQTDLKWQPARAWPAAPAHASLNMAMPWQAPAPPASSLEKLSLASSLGKIALPQAAAVHQCGQPWGQALTSAQAAQWQQAAPWQAAPWQHSTGAPAVDMLVLPSGNSCPEARRDDDSVKVSYTSAEELADALFPTELASGRDLHAQLADHSQHLEELSDHRELVHTALLDHRDKVNELNEKAEMVDEGLLDHRKHISQLRSQSADVLKRIGAQENALSKLQKDMQSLNNSCKSNNVVLGMHAEGLAALKAQNKELTAQGKEFDRGLRSHSACLDLQNSGLKSLTAKHEALSSTQLQVKEEISSLSKTLKKQSVPESDARQQQIQQLQTTMLETQAQISRLTSQQQPLKTVEVISGPRVRR